MKVSYNPSAPRTLERSTSLYNVLTGAISSSLTRDPASEGTEKLQQPSTVSTRSLNSPAGSPSQSPSSRAVSLPGSVTFEDRTIKQSNIDTSYEDSVRTVVLHNETGSRTPASKDSMLYRKPLWKYQSFFYADSLIRTLLLSILHLIHQTLSSPRRIYRMARTKWARPSRLGKETC